MGPGCEFTRCGHNLRQWGLVRVGLGAAIRFTSMGPRASILMHYDMSFSKVGARLRNDTLFSRIIQNCRLSSLGAATHG